MSAAFVPLLPDILQQIEQAVHARTGGRIQELRIRVDDGCLVLSGQTKTYYNKQLATRAVRDTVEDIPFQNDVKVG